MLLLNKAEDRECEIGYVYISNEEKVEVSKGIVINGGRSILVMNNILIQLIRQKRGKIHLLCSKDVNQLKNISNINIVDKEDVHSFFNNIDDSRYDGEFIFGSVIVIDERYMSNKLKSYNQVKLKFLLDKLIEKDVSIINIKKTTKESILPIEQQISLYFKETIVGEGCLKSYKKENEEIKDIKLNVLDNASMWSTLVKEGILKIKDI